MISLLTFNIGLLVNKNCESILIIEGQGLDKANFSHKQTMNLHREIALQPTLFVLKEEKLWTSLDLKMPFYLRLVNQSFQNGSNVI